MFPVLLQKKRTCQLFGNYKGLKFKINPKDVFERGVSIATACPKALGLNKIYFPSFNLPEKWGGIENTYRGMVMVDP